MQENYSVPDEHFLFLINKKCFFLLNLTVTLCSLMVNNMFKNNAMHVRMSCVLHKR